MLDMIIVNPAYRQDLDTLLFDYITTKGMSKLCGVSPPEISDLTRATARSLLAAGADIDAREGPDGPTALYTLCDHYRKGRFSTHKCEFIRLLVKQYHANPWAKCGSFEHNTPAAHIKSALEKGRYMEKAKPLLEALVAGFLEDATEWN